MSSGPVGLDVHEYSYSTKYVAIPGGALPTDDYRISAANAWMVTRIRYWAGSAGGYVAINEAIPVAANGCVCLEPNGAHREDVFCAGAGSIIIVEYWFQARPDGTRPTITVTVT